MPESLGLALELQAAVDAERGDRTRCIAPAVGQRLVQPVAGGVQRQPWHHVPARLAPRIADGAHGMPAFAQQTRSIGLARGQREAVELGGQRGLNAVPTAVQVQADLRTALVGRRHQLVAALQHLPLLHPRVRQPAAASHAKRSFDATALHEQARREAAVGVWKVFPPAVVGDAHHIGPVAQVAWQFTVVHPMHGLARAVGGAVERQQFSRQCAVVGRVEVAEFGVQPKAATGQHAWHQGGIPVGRDIPVVRHRQFDAAAAVDVQAGRQPT